MKDIFQKIFCHIDFPNFFYGHLLKNALALHSKESLFSSIGCFFPQIDNFPHPLIACRFNHSKFSSISSNSFNQTCTEASDGMRKSPLGDTATLPTFGPSGRQERLNC